MTLSVLVVGAGPVGLTLAAELARQGGHCRLIERLPQPLPYCRALGVTPRSLEILEGLGVTQPLIDAGVWLEPMATVLEGRLLTPPPDPAGSPGQPPAGSSAMARRCGRVAYGDLAVPQPELERRLGELLARQGVSVERGVSLEALQPLQVDPAAGRPPGLTVSLRHGESRLERLTVDVVVGCDGAHSTVRHGLAIPFEGEAMAEGFMLGDVAIDWDLPRGRPLRALRFSRDDGPPDLFVAIPLPEPGRYRVSMLAPPLAASGGSDLRPGDGVAHGLGDPAGQGPSLTELQRVADDLLPSPAPRLSDLRWSSTYRISMRLAARYRQGSAFLAGDAAHIHPPTGGQGMNTGLQDAHNLAWKLALVQRGLAPWSLLESYENERRPVGAEVIRRTLEASLNFGRETAPPDPLLNTQLLVSYRDTPLVRDPEPGSTGENLRAGDRAPDADGLRRRHGQLPLRLFDLLRAPRHALIVSLVPGADPSAARVLAARLRQRLSGDALQSYLVVCSTDLHDAPADTAELVVLIDRDGCFQATYGPEPMALLVRPDGHIAWRQPGRLPATDLPRGLEEVLDLTFQTLEPRNSW